LFLKAISALPWLKMGQARTLTLQAVDARRFIAGSFHNPPVNPANPVILSKNQFAIPESYPEGSSVSA
jgi:hypothetical protein